jgi:hypothetical protein
MDTLRTFNAIIDRLDMHWKHFLHWCPMITSFAIDALEGQIPTDHH